MTAATPMPTDLHQWVTRYLPALARTTDTSWPRSTSQVWRVDSGTEAVYAKISPSKGAFERELRGYQHAATALPPHGAPKLIAYDRPRLAILTSGVAGSVVRGLPLAAVVEARVHHLAGSLLQLWHTQPRPCPAGARHAVATSLSAQAAEATACLAATADLLTDAERALVSEAAHDLPALAASLELSYLHGDFSPRNWLWNPDTETLALLDFEAADHALPVQDMIWLCGAVWPTRPELREAFLSGYGRELGADEERVLLLLTARLAVSYLTTGLSNGDQVLIDRGRTVLGDLVRTHVGTSDVGVQG